MRSAGTKLIISVYSLLVLAACNNTTTQSTSGTTDSVSAVSAAADSAKDALKNAQGKTEEMTNKGVTAAEEAMKDNPDSSFVVEVLAANDGEIGMLQEGIDKGTSKNLKSTARKMLADHKGLKKTLEKYAAKNNYPFSAVAAQMPDNMNDAAGAEWDKAWALHMFNGHEKTIGKFEGAKNEVKDDALKTIIENTLPTLNAHLDMVKKLQAEL